MTDIDLIIIDCDGVLYEESELDKNAIIYGFNKACEVLSAPDAKIKFVEDCTKDKPVKGVYNYINYVANKIGISPESFIKKTVEHIDYSHIQPDQNGILEKLKKIQNKFKICICSNNHLLHINEVIKAKFTMESKELPFEIFDMTYAEKDGEFYPKESDVFIQKLEKHFNISADRFLWIDDSQQIIEKLKTFGSKTILTTPQKRLIDILTEISITVL